MADYRFYTLPPEARTDAHWAMLQCPDCRFWLPVSRAQFEGRQETWCNNARGCDFSERLVLARPEGIGAMMRH